MPAPGSSRRRSRHRRLRPCCRRDAVVAGDGAVRYRDLLEGAEIPPDDSPLHVPHARHHAALHAVAGPPDPCYLRAPDADRVLAARAAR